MLDQMTVLATLTHPKAPCHGQVVMGLTDLHPDPTVCHQKAQLLLAAHHHSMEIWLSQVIQAGQAPIGVDTKAHQDHTTLPQMTMITAQLQNYRGNIEVL